MMKKASILVLIFALMSAPVFAAMEASPWTKEKSCVDKATAKLGFGLKNAILGWTKILTEISETKDGNYVKGFATGIYEAIADTALGVVHAATFFVPIDVPLPEGGVQLTK